MSDFIRSFNPLRNTGTAMRPNTLLVAKLAFVILCADGFTGYLQKPFLPFFESLNHLGEIPGYTRLLKAAFLGGGILLLANRLVRPASILLGLVVLLANVQSQVNFRNHIVICGCALLLAGLQPAGQQPWLIRWQMVLVYLGAWLNKQTDPDWLDGKFFEYWTHANMQHGAYIYLAGLLPAYWLSTVLSWTTILSEFLVMLGLCFRRWWTAALWLGLLFHLATFIFTLGNPFGHFVQSLGVVYLSFLTWPEQQGTARLPAGPLAKVLQRLDTDRVWNWKGKSDGGVPEVELGGKRLAGMAAIREILFYSTGFYWALLTSFEIFIHIFPWPWSFLTSLIVLLAAIIPFAWPEVRAIAGRLRKHAG